MSVAPGSMPLGPRRVEAVVDLERDAAEHRSDDDAEPADVTQRQARQPLIGRLDAELGVDGRGVRGQRVVGQDHGLRVAGRAARADHQRVPGAMGGASGSVASGSRRPLGVDQDAPGGRIRPAAPAPATASVGRPAAPRRSRPMRGAARPRTPECPARSHPPADPSPPQGTHRSAPTRGGRASELIRSVHQICLFRPVSPTELCGSVAAGVLLVRCAPIGRSVARTGGEECLRRTDHGGDGIRRAPPERWPARRPVRPGEHGVLFPTFEFAVFFSGVFVVSWLLRPHPVAWRLFLLAASFVFYAAFEPRLLPAAGRRRSWATRRFAVAIHRTADAGRGG